MKVKALKSFSGEVSMHIGEVKDIDDKDILADLTAAGYIEQEKPKRSGKNEGKRDNE